jgi:hypothetical protein
MYRKMAILVLSAAQFGCGGGGDDGGALNMPLPSNIGTGVKSGVPVLSANATLIGTSPGIVPAWPDGSTVSGGTGTPIGGVVCQQNENYHIHSHLTIIKDGVTQRIPGEIGLTGCAYELHTHDDSGMLHVETSIAKKFTLGQFFLVWGEPLSRTNIAGLSGESVRFFISDNDNVVEYTDDPNAIELVSHRSIYIVIGAVPATLPKNQWPAGF